MKTLFICRGNVARSQMAEAFMKKLSGGGEEAFSAGTKLSGPEEPLGNLLPAIENVIIAMKEEGVDLSGAVRKNLTPEMAERADRIVLVVSDRDPLPDYILTSPKIIRWDVLDPKGQSLDFTRRVRDQIQLLVSGLLTRP